MESSTPQFGAMVPGKTYTDRPGAYGIIVNDKKEVAVMEVGGDYWLPGGGIDEGETEIEAMVREAKEEIGCEIRIIQVLGKADQYLYAEDIDKYLRKCGTFFEAEIVSMGEKIEENHNLVWLSPEDAIGKLSEFQAWAVDQYLISHGLHQRMDARPGTEEPGPMDRAF
jgi:8-oxo-dGTP diphosphatase